MYAQQSAVKQTRTSRILDNLYEVPAPLFTNDEKLARLVARVPSATDSTHIAPFPEVSAENEHESQDAAVF